MYPQKNYYGYFNPRLREGGDLERGAILAVLPSISIHASAKEATRIFHRIIYNFKFQSTPPRRRRHIKFFATFKSTNFNPRLREGGDQNNVLTTQTQKISIHASAKEATATYCNTPAIMCICSFNNFFVHHF